MDGGQRMIGIRPARHKDYGNVSGSHRQSIKGLIRKSLTPAARHFALSSVKQACPLHGIDACILFRRLDGQPDGEGAALPLFAGDIYAAMVLLNDAIHH
jgi:hypothetical protein